MKLIYTNENRILVSNARNLLEMQGIELIWKNEFAHSAGGATSPLDTWPELWVRNDADYARASLILENALSKEGAPEWTCGECGEVNDASFETCWKCRGDSTQIQ